jgi:hypothetical protein
MHRSRLYNNSNSGSAAYASYLEAYFEHVRTTNALFRTIHDTLHAAPSSRPVSRIPTRDPRQYETSAAATSMPSAPSAPPRSDDNDYISGVTFNIPINDNDPTNIFNLLSAYVAGSSGAGAGAGAGAYVPTTASRNIANNGNRTNNSSNGTTIAMRYSDIANIHRTYDACPITREPFADDERVLMLQCNHYFSENGLTRWLISHNTCPICRFNINSNSNNNNSNNINTNNNNNNNNNNTNNNIIT